MALSKKVFDIEIPGAGNIDRFVKEDCLSPAPLLRTKMKITILYGD